MKVVLIVVTIVCLCNPLNIPNETIPEPKKNVEQLELSDGWEIHKRIESLDELIDNDEFDERFRREFEFAECIDWDFYEVV